MSENNDEEMFKLIITLIVAFFLPPLGVAIKKGLGGAFLLNLLLTLLAWLPGVIHAFYVIMKD